MSQGNLPVPQMVQTGMSMNQNMMSGTGTTGMPSGTGNMMPTPGMSQQIQPGMQPVGVNSNNSVTNMPLNQQTSSTIQPAQSKYVKVWRGTYLDSDKASLFSSPDWRQYVGKADFLVFRAMDQHGFLGQLQEKKLCAVIQLPSQTLLLSVSDKAYRLIGMLFPGSSNSYKHNNTRIYNSYNNSNSSSSSNHNSFPIAAATTAAHAAPATTTAHAAPATAAAHAASTTATATTTAAAAAAADPTNAATATTDGGYGYKSSLHARFWTIAIVVPGASFLTRRTSYAWRYLYELTRLILYMQ
ncbi:UNVERIFIED_CONTAM: Mediator of RNA polymerase II transcription subunit [Sesamum angustifolium]|uniref:Mediator of RNA polymerase II transcription subunit n=1 Tax=Sesamum angustifolium TaxID=2727405 RepID=A0AAW2RMQ3_9LAMI